MHNLEMLPALLRAFNDNQIALAAAIDEIADWAEESGHLHLAGKVRIALRPVDENLKTVLRTLVLLQD